MKYLVKSCLKCGSVFNTRPAYNKEHCKKCQNAIRMYGIYIEDHPHKRVLFVKGDVNKSKIEWAKRNRDKVKLGKHSYRYERNGIKKDREWASKNIEKVRMYRHKNEMKRRGILPTHTLSEWEDLKHRKNFTCTFCERKEPEIKITKDHIIPISRWEMYKNTVDYDCDDIRNIQPLCKSCNSKKHNNLVNNS